MGTTNRKNLKPLPFFGAFAQIIGAGVNAANTSHENHLNRQWQEKMYQQALADQREDTQLSRDWQEKMTANDQQWQQKMFDASNEWNSVGAQVDRARKAGVNPLAALGVSSAGGYSSLNTPSTSTPAASVGTPRTSTPRWGDMISAASQGYLQDVQAENIQADTDLKRSQANYTDTQNQLATIDANFRESLNKAILDGKLLENHAREIENSIKNIELSYSPTLFEQRVAQGFAQLDNLKADTDVKHALERDYIAAAALKGAEKGWYDAKTVSELYVRQNLLSQTELNMANKVLAQVQTEDVAKSTELKGATVLLIAEQTKREKILIEAGIKENEAKGIANELARFESQFRQKHAEADRRWDKAKMVTSMVHDLATSVGSLSGGVGVALGRVGLKSVSVSEPSTLLGSDGKPLYHKTSLYGVK